MMRLTGSRTLRSLACLMVLGGCTASVDDAASVTEDLSFVECTADTDCDRGEACLTTGDRPHSTGYCATGDRCTTSLSCPRGSVCRGERPGYCLVIEAEPERPTVCPRGSRPLPLSCAPGFDLVGVTLDCGACERGVGIIDRCRAAGIDPRRCRAIAGGGDDPSSIHDRCRAAGHSPERCRALVHTDRDRTLPLRRCREAGLTYEECREMITGEEEPTRRERCRVAGLSPERCAALLAPPTREEEARRERVREEDEAQRGERG